MRRAGLGVIVLLISSFALAGCGATPRQEVEAKVQQFAHATASKDYAELCDEVLAPALVAHLEAAGLSCRQAMKVFASSVENPAIRVSRVSVDGSTAVAVVVATATNQRPSRQSIHLIKTDHGWRLNSLASAR